MTGSRTMLIARSDDGYFGLKQSLAGVFARIEAGKEHCVTEDVHTVAQDAVI